MIPRMTQQVTQKKAVKDAGTRKATVTGAIGDNAGAYYIRVAGRQTLARTTIDAPIRVGDMVYVRESHGGGGGGRNQTWVIVGTA